MQPGDKESIAQTLDALERLMRMFQAERIIYLMSAAASFVLLIYAAYLMFSSGAVTPAEMGLIFGATGVSAISGSRIAYFLNKSFNLIEDIVRNLTGVGPRREP
ncbi:MAG TPA: hypothetical protein VEX35_03860 [Allosphingosinicella sp.]|nr:hypothetical protein [Allosphingosinicella sp.]